MTAAELPAGASKGTWKLICVGETKYSGAATPPTKTLTLPRLTGQGIDGALKLPVAKLEPKTVPRPPRASLVLKLAAFTTPPPLICGGGPPPLDAASVTG